MGKLVRAVLTTLAIVAGPALVNLVEGPLPISRLDLHLRGSIDGGSDLQLRGSLW